MVEVVGPFAKKRAHSAFRIASPLPCFSGISSISSVYRRIADHGDRRHRASRDGHRHRDRDRSDIPGNRGGRRRHDQGHSDIPGNRDDRHRHDRRSGNPDIVADTAADKVAGTEDEPDTVVDKAEDTAADKDFAGRVVTDMDFADTEPGKVAVDTVVMDKVVADTAAVVGLGRHNKDSSSIAAHSNADQKRIREQRRSDFER